MKKEFSAGVIVYKLNEKNERMYLLLLYPRGYWDFAKGKLENQESNIEAAIRELKEETNLEANIDINFEYNLEYFFKDYKGQMVHKHVIFFTGQAINQDVVLSQEHLNFQWANFQDSLKQLTFENAKSALTKVEEFLKTS